MHSRLAKLTANPKAIFLLDGAGAALSALLLAAMAIFNTVFGMPQNILLALAAVAVVFCIYSFCCYHIAGNRWRIFLTGIAVANGCYSVVTLWLVYYHYRQLTILGVVYFILEVVVIYVLVLIELKAITATRT